MEPEAAEPRRALADAFVSGYPGEAAAALERLEVPSVGEFLDARRLEEAVTVLERMRPELAADLLGVCTPERAGAVLAALDPARATVLLARHSAETREQFLGLLPAATAEELRALSEYPADSAGAMMDPSFPAFRPSDRVGDALVRLRRLRERRLAELPLIDDEGRLIGGVLVQDVALADPDDALETLVRGETAHVHATATRDEVLELMQSRRIAHLPVIAFDGRLLGLIRPAGMVEAAEVEASAGLQTMVGASRDERALSPPLFAVRKRQLWLQINLGTAFLAASVVALFEDTIAQFTALAVLLPVVAGQSGNTGSQALAVTMRGLALREIRSRHLMRVARKEMLAASLNGLAVSATTCLGVYLWSRSLGLTFVIGVSMVISMTLAGLAGAIIPITLAALRQDPAQSSSIVLTTVTDVVGFMSFLGIATLLAFAL